jgi:hypothetical protein
VFLATGSPGSRPKDDGILGIPPMAIGLGGIPIPPIGELIGVAGGVAGLFVQPEVAACSAAFCASLSPPANMIPDRVPVKNVAIGIINSKNFWSIGLIAFNGCVTKIIE